jgi:hypothetical protein
MKDKTKRKCPSCKKTKLKRVIGTPMVFIKGEPQTVGHQAERNTEKMGRYELGDKEGKRKESSKKEQSSLGSGPASPRQIRKMTSEQKKKYIEKGTK